jgi:tRNA threonylcarbamoyladenosine biosynthesis protein TsaE
MEHHFTIKNESEIERVAQSFLPLLQRYKVAAFYGAMGVGKTTFIKGLCRTLGVSDPVSSPSFAIVNEYLTDAGEVIFHFDFYRLKRVEEVFDMGYEEYFFSDRVCLIEWPEKIAEVLPEQRLDIFLEEKADGSRSLRVVEKNDG